MYNRVGWEYIALKVISEGEKTVNEFENIPYVRLKGIRIFLNTVMYRNPHFHKSMEWILVLAGEMKVNTGQNTQRLRANDIILINSGSPHELAACTTDCTFLCVQFTPESYLQNFPTILFDCNLPSQYLSPQQYQHIVQRMLQMALFYFQEETFYDVYCVSTVYEILYTFLTKLPFHELTNKKNRQELMSARLMRLVDYVDKNYMRHLTLADFAKAEGRSLSYISRFVKSALNQSFQSYVNTVRFYSACRLIEENKMSMLDICYEVGFSDYRYFSNVFKERTGTTPAQFQQMERAPHRYFSTYDQEHIYSNEESVSFLENLAAERAENGDIP